MEKKLPRSYHFISPVTLKMGGEKHQGDALKKRSAGRETQHTNTKASNESSDKVHLADVAQ